LQSKTLGQAAGDAVTPAATQLCAGGLGALGHGVVERLAVRAPGLAGQRDCQAAPSGP